MDMEEAGERADRQQFPFPVPDGHVKLVPVSPLLSISGLSGISLIARPAGDVSSISGCTVLNSGLVAPTRFSGTKDFERPARE